MKDKHNIAEVLRKISLEAYGEESSIKIAGIICYETGDVLRDLVRMEDYPNIKDIYFKCLKVSLGDVLAMSQLLCCLLGLDFKEIYELGCQRAVDRCNEKLEGRDGF